VFQQHHEKTFLESSNLYRSSTT